MLLQDQGYATVSAANGREGMENAKEHTPDFICLDITMPEESGVHMYRNLKKDPQLAPIPVLVVTAVTGLGGDPGTPGGTIRPRRASCPSPSSARSSWRRSPRSWRSQLDCRPEARPPTRASVTPDPVAGHEVEALLARWPSR
jgi:hypothetical protein